MIIILSTHARQRLREREISFQDVKEAIKNPDFKKKVDLGRTLIRKSLGKEILEIIYKEESNKIIIVTLYYL